MLLGGGLRIRILNVCLLKASCLLSGLWNVTQQILYAGQLSDRLWCLVRGSTGRAVTCWHCKRWWLRTCALLIAVSWSQKWEKTSGTGSSVFSEVHCRISQDPGHILSFGESVP